MQTKNHVLFLLFLFLLGMTGVSCGGDDDSAVIVEDSTPDPDPTLTDPDCDTSIDADCDGIWGSCDEDDMDDTVGIKALCDTDADGYVNTSCDVYADKDGDMLISADEREAYGYNCDVCPQKFDPEQLDTDQDGIGDACANEEQPVADDDEEDDQDDPNDPVTDDVDVAASAKNSPLFDMTYKDSDDDGLNDSIDPAPQKFNLWGFINKDDVHVTNIHLTVNPFDYQYIDLESALQDVIGQGEFAIDELQLKGIDTEGRGHVLPTVARSAEASDNSHSLPFDNSSQMNNKKVIQIEYGIYVLPYAHVKKPFNQSLGRSGQL